MNSGYKQLSIIMHVIFFYSNNGTKLELISPVISAAVLCGEVVCDTSPETSDPVRFELVHKPQVRMLIKVWLDYSAKRLAVLGGACPKNNDYHCDKLF